MTVVKSSGWKPSVISAHSLPPLLASGAHSIGYYIVPYGCLLFVYRLDLMDSTVKQHITVSYHRGLPVVGPCSGTSVPECRHGATRIPFP